MRTMMGVVCGVLLLCWSGSVALAQEKEQERNQDKEHYQSGTAHQPMIKDGVMMKDGKMYQVKDGKMTELDKETTLTNGWRVNNDGTVMMGPGTEVQMKDGIAIDEHGKIMDQSGRVITREQLESAYKSSRGSNRGVQGGMMSRDGVMMKDGKMWEVKGGKDTELTHEVTLKNGWRVNSDGRVMMANGQSIQMKEGEILDMSGKVVRAGKMGKKMMQGGMQRMDSTMMGKPEPR